MAIINCKECGGKVSTEANTCPHCGFVYRRPNQPRGRPMVSGGCLGMLILLCGGFYLVNKVFMDSIDSPTHISEPIGQSATQGDPDGSRAWYVGGNLHRATMLEWRTANHRNKLATCADFITAAKKMDGASFVDVDGIRGDAEELVKCIEQAAKEGTIDTVQITDVASACLVLMKSN
jgi:hypothetical protein